MCLVAGKESRIVLVDHLCSKDSGCDVNLHCSCKYLPLFTPPWRAAAEKAVSIGVRTSWEMLYVVCTYELSNHAASR